MAGEGKGGPRIVEAGAGRVLHVLGARLLCLLDGEATGGSLAYFLDETDPGGGPPLHVHRREDEVFHVLEGRYEFTVGGKRVDAPAGTTLYGPRGIPHTFRNSGSGRARMLVTVTPAGIEKFFEEMDRRVGVLKGPPDMKIVGEVLARYGIEMA